MHSAGGDLVHRALLHRASRGAQVRPEADSPRLREHVAADAARLGHRRLRHDRRAARRLLRRSRRAHLFGRRRAVALGLLLAALYVLLLGYSSRYPRPAGWTIRREDLPPARPWPTVRAGLHFFIPIVVLLWCLMVEEFSPGLSAFWATATAMALVIVQPAMLSAMRRQPAITERAAPGVHDAVERPRAAARAT